MHKTIKLALTAATPVLLLAGCSDFLKGPGLTTNPNQPVTATANQMYVGIQVAVMAQYENYPLMLFMTWSQNIAGVNRQWQTYASYSSGTDQTAANGAWDQTYGPGGLRDIRLVEDSLTASGNLQWRGELRVLEALYMGTAADIWGSVPWTDSAGITAKLAPTFDSQAAVYAHVLALLDSAIADLGGGGTLPVPDFFYNNNVAGWTQMAHTLKARYFMHTAPTSATTYNAGNLASVMAEATLGIAADSFNFQPQHTGQPGQQNLFYSFQFSRAGDVAPANVHITQTKAAGEASILTRWYTPSTTSVGIYGACAGGPVTCPPDTSTIPIDSGKPYASDSISIFEVTTDPSAEWPIVSFAENQMLMAEAQVLTGNTAGGLATLNTYRGTTDGGGSPALVSGVASVVHQWILREKFVHSFFNMETWADYLRTCYPNVPTPLTVNNNADYVPGRLPVGQTEQNTNPNVPPQNNGTNPMNANNFKHALALDGTVCTEQVNMP